MRGLTSFTSLTLPALLITAVAAQEPAPTPAPAGTPQLSTAERVRVNEFRFTGNTVYSAKELSEVLKSYTGRELTAEELEQARRALTQFYVQHGYVNSGAVLEDQPLQDGIITFKIIEGVVKNITISGSRQFDRRFLASRIRRSAQRPLNVIKLRNSLQLLRQNPNLRQLNANVQPGGTPGEANLEVQVEETNPHQPVLTLDNHRPPSVGAERLRFAYTHTNLTGWDDSLSLSTGLTRNGLTQSGLSSLHDFSLGYKSPEFLWDTRLLFNYSKGDTAVIEEPFRDLDISSRSENISVGIRQPLKRTLTEDVALTLSLEHRESKSFLFGIPFSFSRGDVDGVAETTAIRFGQEYLRREATHVFAARTLLSWGDNFSGSTKNPTPPSGEFLTLLAQVQYIRVLNERGNQLLVRADGQWSNNPLLSVEKFSIGGAGSVRGYRENQLVRDTGLVLSAEYRVPVKYDRIGRETWTLAAFADYGYGKDRDEDASPDLTHISSVGLGILYNSRRRLEGQLYWGYALKRPSSSGSNLQDDGIHFALAYKL